MLVKFALGCRQTNTCYAFVTTVSEDGAGPTTALLLGSLDIETPPCLIKITVLAKINSRIRHASTHFVLAAECGGTRATAAVTCANATHSSKVSVTADGCVLTDVTADACDALKQFADEAVLCMRDATQSFGWEPTATPKHRDLLELSATMLEPEWPGSVRVPSTSGYVQALANDIGDVHAIFTTCLVLARIACVDEAHMQTEEGLEVDPSTVQKRQECLFVCAVRMYAGHYPAIPELTDDRTLRGTKLYTNTDCDDMAITCMSFVRALMAASKTWCAVSNQNYAAKSIVCAVATRIKDVYCCTGEVNQPGTGIMSSLFGNPETFCHVWCMIKMESGGCLAASQRHLHLEATRLMSCHATDSATPMDMYAGMFCESKCADRGGLTAFRIDTYISVCTMHSATRMYVPSVDGRMGVPYSAVINGDAQLVPVTQTQKLSDEHDFIAVRHHVDSAMIQAASKHVHVNYTQPTEQAGAMCDTHSRNCYLSATQETEHSTVYTVSPANIWWVNEL